MKSDYSNKIKDVLSYSREEAVRLGNSSIETEHLFLGILRDGEGIAIKVLINLGVELPELKQQIEAKLKGKVENKDYIDPDTLPLLKSTERILKLVSLVAKEMKSETITTVHLLLAILKDETNLVTQILEKDNIDYYTVQMEYNPNLNTPRAEFSDEDEERGGFGAPKGQPQTPGNLPAIHLFSITLELI